MSKINILRIIKNIKSKTNVYTPLVEAIVNSIEAIGDFKNGKIEIIVKRELTLGFDNCKPSIICIEIRDNGVGFNQKNRDSFDTFFSEAKKELGGKGFGRFMFLKYFNEVKIESIFFENSIFFSRNFRFGKEEEIIVDEIIEPSKKKQTGTKLFLNTLLEDKQLDKGLDIIARKLVEKLLVFFANDKFKVPTIILREDDKSESYILNEFIKDDNSISLVGKKSISISSKYNQSKSKLEVKVFKIYYSTSCSKISLTANNREVEETSLHNYIPEFQDDFYDMKNGVRRNYVIKAYVLGDYLNNNVSYERESFDFPKETSNEFYEFSQSDIEKEAALVVKEFFNNEVIVRFEKKKQSVRSYVSCHAPWNKVYLSDFDFTDLPYNPSPERIEMEFQKYKFIQESNLKREISDTLTCNEINNSEKLHKLISQITENGKSDLAHYVCNRKLVIDTFDSLRKRRENDSPHLESEIHNLIFPMGENDYSINYEDHNLWLLDERLVFSQYIASDKRISNEEKGEPDLVVFYDEKCTYRNGENEITSPLTVFEFKRPKRTTYSDADNPIIQACRYVDKIRQKKYEMPEGIEPIKINDNTPVYIYIICDLADKITEFAKMSGCLTISPDGEGYFGFHKDYHVYIEIISFKKLICDAKIRNKIFFKKLGLD